MDEQSAELIARLYSEVSRLQQENIRLTRERDAAVRNLGLERATNREPEEDGPFW